MEQGIFYFGDTSVTMVYLNAALKYSKPWSPGD